MKYALETFTDELVEELRPLWAEQYEELSNVKGVIKLDPDIDQFNMLQDSDVLKVITVRKDGNLEIDVADINEILANLLSPSL